MTGRWVELADGVLVRRYRETGSVARVDRRRRGVSGRDTRVILVQGAEWAAAVRRVTKARGRWPSPTRHWTTAFGTAEFLPSDVWEHEGCRADLAAPASKQRDDVARRYGVRPAGPDGLPTDLGGGAGAAGPVVRDRPS